MTMYLRGGSYEEICRDFSWRIPERFNIAHAICDRHVGGNREALIVERPDGSLESFTFERIHELSCRLANAFAAHGVQRGDRVAILLSQCAETLLAHLAAFRLGAISVPLFTLFGPEAISYRVQNSGARLVVTNDDGLSKLLPIRSELPDLATIFNIDGPRGHAAVGLEEAMDRASSRHEMVDTSSDDPAFLLYTSGTTASPKGVLNAHRALLGNLPGIELIHDLLPQPGDRMWTPADWAWAGGLLTTLFPGLFYGLTVVACRFAKFDPLVALDLMVRHRVRNIFMPPTALRMLRRAAPAGRQCDLRSIASGGEKLDADTLAWSQDVLGAPISEYYGQTEISLCIGNSPRLFPTRTGSMGRAVPGHEPSVIDDEGQELPPGSIGQLAFRAPNPVMFLHYWNDPERTATKYRGEWCLSGDLCHRDDEGYFWFHARDDDVIISSGYTIGPEEIEACLMRHPAVDRVAVVGAPDEIRGQVVKAVVVLAAGYAPSDDVAAEIQDFVKSRLSSHEYPRQIAFRDSLPTTVTGKIRRKEVRDS